MGSKSLFIDILIRQTKCVYGRVCLCGSLDHARVKQEVAHFDWAGPEVLQSMYVVCESVLLCVCGQCRRTCSVSAGSCPQLGQESS